MRVKMATKVGVIKAALFPALAATTAPSPGPIKNAIPIIPPETAKYLGR
jgi:hypothetical protein